jgi:hypothetical protein
MAGMRSGITGPGAAGNGRPGDDEKKSTAPSQPGTVPPSSSISGAVDRSPDDSSSDATIPTRVRPTRLTPGAAGLAALIAHSRTKFGPAHDARNGEPLTPKVDAAEVTVVGGLFGDEKIPARDARSAGGFRTPPVTPASENAAGSSSSPGIEAFDPEDSGPTEQWTPILEEYDGSDVTGAITAVDGQAAVGESSIPAGRNAQNAPDDGEPGTKPARAARPMRLTPGGTTRLAALLLQARAKNEPRGQRGDGDARLNPENVTPTVTTPAKSSDESSMVISFELEAETPRPEIKNPKFATTLHGVPVPDVSVPAPWVAPGKQGLPEGFDSAHRNRKEVADTFGHGQRLPAAGAKVGSSRETPRGLGGSTTPHAVDDEELTEKNPLNARASRDEPRTEDMFPVVRRRRPGLAIGAAATTALVVLTVGIFLSRRKAAEESMRSLVHQPALPAGAAAEVMPHAQIVKIEPPTELSPPAGPPANAKAKAETEIGTQTETGTAIGTIIAPVPAQGASAEDSPVSPRPRAEEPAMERGRRSDKKDDLDTAAIPDQGTSPPPDDAAVESKRTAETHSDSRRPGVRRASTKRRDKTVDANSKVSQTSSLEAPVAPQAKDQSRTRAVAPARPLEYDPDATLPLMGR